MDEVATRCPRTAAAPLLSPIRVHGKFFFAGEQKHFVKGVTYGPFVLGSHGAQFPEARVAENDFALMREAGVNTVRVFSVPPLWLLDAAHQVGLQILVGLPWPQHIAFLESAGTQREIRETVSAGVRACRRHPAVFGYLVGNEIPPDMIRWHGVEPVRRFVHDLVKAAKNEHADGLVAYANFPSTEYLTIDFTDFVCFNVYLHEETTFRRYIARLHNLAVDQPLVLTEFGVDSMREGEEGQRRILSWQIRSAFASGVAGTFVFAWTDEWFTGGHLIEDWAFGIVDHLRRPKPSFREVARQYQRALPPPLPRYPRVSVVVCAYNADRTLDQCLASLARVDYPDYEVILVNDGSRDRTLEIAQAHGFCRIISQANKGLSGARNVGAEAATGEIVAYTDSDCVVDPDWLTYLVAKMEASGLAACGGPNLPPPEDGLIPSVVAVAPGGPTHVLISDEMAEHIAGCNMAFRRDVLFELGGFDPIYRAAGDDVDICWRFQDAGYVIGFSPAALVWHFRRNTVTAYCNQQRGYGKAEALVYAKHPFRFNLFGQAKWLGRIYGDLSGSLLLSRRPVIYSGVFGRGLFQTMYEPPSSLAASLPLSFEWSAASLALAVGGVAAGGWLWLCTVPLLVTWVVCINGACQAPIDKRFTGLNPTGIRARALTAFLIYLGPLLRGWERTRWRMRLTRAQGLTGLPETEQRARVYLRERAFHLCYWNDGGAEKEVLLSGLTNFLIPQKYLVILDTGWSRWDLKIARGLCSRSLVTVCTENHGSGKRLLRVRCAMRLSRPAMFLLRGYAALTACALILGWPLAAAVISAIGVLNSAAIGCQLVAFGRLMHRIIEAVAKQAGLMPLEPIARDRLSSPSQRPNVRNPLMDGSPRGSPRNPIVSG
ncbi:MAG: glycosyltransferase [Alphaproteobacteria bacterium]|nr:glycosyltransferase [Alphaproteobacteria bacterium]